jgi:hypothetical protein
MADNPPQPPPKANPPLPSSGMTGRLKSPTTQLPFKKVEKGGAGKIVVMLSSVAKPPPATTQSISMVAPPLKAPANVVTTGSVQIMRTPAPLPPKQVAPASSPVQKAPGARLTSTTFVKLPPKTAVPPLSFLGASEVPTEKTPQPLLPPKRTEPVTPAPKKTAQHIPAIKLNEPAADDSTPDDSLFLPADTSKPAAKPPGWKPLAPGELDAPSESLLLPTTPAPVAKAPPAQIAPPMLAKETHVESKPALNPAPVSLTSAHPVQSAHPIHVVPPMLEKETEPEPPSEKLPQPHHPSEAKKSEADAPESIFMKAPALISSEPPAPAKALLPPTSPVSKIIDGRKKTAQIILAPLAPKNPQPNIAEARPALKPPVLPKRSQPLPVEPETELPIAPAPVEAKKPEEPPAPKPEDKIAEVKPEEKKADEKKIEPPAPVPAETPTIDAKKEVTVALVPTAIAAVVAAKLLEEKPAPVKLKPATKPDTAPPVASVINKKKAALPPTRVERAKKRKVAGVLIFWLVLVPLTGLALVMGSFYFGRDTRVEGQIVPPAGMTVNNEVWVVSDFRDLSAGIAEDLAKERTPLMQEVQERRDHVQRAQADVASREERIRLIQDEMQAAKDEIASLIKKSRDDTQQIWDGAGAEIDNDYQSKLSQLKHAIADRAKTLNLKYTPDDTYQSPEVWANAYRLALYEVPKGVDALKEHQWLSDQMKQWRDFEKSLDDKKEQLREKAAQMKLEPAPKINDLNAKIQDLGQRIDGTTAEEVPLKAELQQAQVDLAQAQAADQGLDQKYYMQLYSLPAENITKHITLAPNGRFTWVEDEAFAEGENVRKYWIFSRAVRGDGRQYWMLNRVSVEKNHKLCLLIDPNSFISTKAILRPDLPPEEQEQ